MFNFKTEFLFWYLGQQTSSWILIWSKLSHMGGVESVLHSGLIQSVEPMRHRNRDSQHDVWCNMTQRIISQIYFHNNYVGITVFSTVKILSWCIRPFGSCEILKFGQSSNKWRTLVTRQKSMVKLDLFLMILLTRL